MAGTIYLYLTISFLFRIQGLFKGPGKLREAEEGPGKRSFQMGGLPGAWGPHPPFEGLFLGQPGLHRPPVKALQRLWREPGAELETSALFPLLGFLVFPNLTYIRGPGPSMQENKENHEYRLIRICAALVICTMAGGRGHAENDI